MRIAMVVGVFPAVPETFIVDQVTGLIDRGHHVDVFAKYRGTPPAHRGKVAAYGLLARAFYQPRKPAGALARGAKAAALVATDCLRHPRHGAGWLRALARGDRAGAATLAYLGCPVVMRQPYDVVHCHFGPYGLGMARLKAAGVLRGRLVVTFHGFDANVVPRRYGEDMYSSLFAHADLCTVGSDFMRRRMLALGARPERLAVLPFGIALERFPFAPRARPGDGPVRILTVGRLMEVKGVEYGIRAVAALRARHPRVRYEIVGDGPLREPLRALVRELGAEGCIDICGELPPPATRERYAQAHVFLAPGIVTAEGAEEGQGLAPIEAQACGIPVVASRVGALPETVRDGVSGLLVPPRDVVALTERLAWLLDNPDRWAAMGAAGRAHVAAHYDARVLADQLEAHYRALV